MASIIERDIEFYSGEIDRLRFHLRECPVEREPAVKERINAVI
jgi:hypothetical protein